MTRTIRIGVQLHPQHAEYDDIRRAVLRAEDIRPGTHLSAIGSDAPHKQELDPGILARASLVVADSRSQCRERGEIAHALDAGAISPDQVSELGEVIAGKSTVGRAIAGRLGLEYLDTGAMYRAVTFGVLRRGLDPHDVESVAAVVASERCFNH